MKKKAYAVDVYETVKKTVLIYAENEHDAASAAKELGGNMELDQIGWEHYALEVSGIRSATVADYSHCERFGF